MQQQTRQSIEEYPVHVGQGAWQGCLHQLVLGYLVHHGYCKTAVTFATSTAQTLNEDISSIKNRQSKWKLGHGLHTPFCVHVGIQACIVRGRVSEAVKLVRVAYPGLLDSNKHLLFQLKCRQFVEMIGGHDNISTDTPRLSCNSELGNSSDGTATPPSRDLATPSSPPINDSNGSVFDNGEVYTVCVCVHH